MGRNFDPSDRRRSLHTCRRDRLPAMHHVCCRLRSLPVHKYLAIAKDHSQEQSDLTQRAAELFDQIRKPGRAGDVPEQLTIASDQLVRDTWDWLHAAKRSNDLQVRYCYAIASISKAIILIEESAADEENLKAALQCLDMALIMSPPLDESAVCSAASQIHQQLPVQLLDPPSITSAPIPLILPIIQKQIPIETDIDVIRFEVEYFDKKRPVVIRNALNHWPALDPTSKRKWSLQYLNEIAGHRTVPVEIGKKYTDQTWSQKLITMNDFMNHYVINDCNREGGQTGYLAQHDLFRQIPELRKDISIPDHCSISSQSDERVGLDNSVETNVWFGPAGTVSPLHFDPQDNILAQVSGCKYIRIYDREIPSHVIYPHEADSLLKHTSQVDVEDVDENKFPAFSENAFDFMAETILREGDAIFIPCQTWHFVKSLTTSVSVSFWWN